MKKQKKLDKIAYSHIQTKGRFSEQIIENQKTMEEEDYYKWLMEVSAYISA